jgi:hypothetical protein
MADYLRSYELARYGRRHLVSYANEIRTLDILDAPFLDFRSVNAYPYAVREHLPPRESRGPKMFLDWIESVKSRHPGRPLLVTETGLSVSPQAPHVGPPGYGYGGNTPEEQAQHLVHTWQDLSAAPLPVAGMCVHEYLDAWGKVGKEDALRHEPGDVDEWFGRVSIEPEGRGDATRPRRAYEALRTIWTAGGRRPQ